MTTTLQNPIHIEISDDESDLNQEWDEKLWIGVGKMYPVSGEVPTFIEAARAKVLALPPPIYSSYIPNLLGHGLPKNASYSAEGLVRTADGMCGE